MPGSPTGTGSGFSCPAVAFPADLRLRPSLPDDLMRWTGGVPGRSRSHTAQISEHTAPVAVVCVAVERENYKGCAIRTRTQGRGVRRTLHKAHGFRAELTSVQEGAAFDNELIAAKGRRGTGQFDSRRAFHDLGCGSAVL